MRAVVYRHFTIFTNQFEAIMRELFGFDVIIRMRVAYTYIRVYSVIAEEKID